MDLRQIDVLVHQHVMGVDLTGFDWPIGFRDQMVRETRDGNGVRIEWIDIPRYSSEIAAAWRVVERMAEMANTATEASAPAEFRAARAFINWWKAQMLWILPAPKAARRICLAALRAMGVEVPEAS